MRKIYINVFPDKLDSGKYLFKNIIAKDTYSLAVYQNKSHKEFIAKYASGIKKNRYYYELKNEIESYKLLWFIINHNRLLINNNFPNICIPKLVFWNETSEYLIMLLEKIPGRLLSKRSVSVQIKIIQETLEYFKYLSTLTKNKYLKLKIRKGWQFVLITPVLYLITAIKYPKILLNIGSIYKLFRENYKNVINSKNIGFVHRDLNSTNIIYDNKKATIFDFQLFLVSNLSHDIANSFYESWKANNTDLDKLLISITTDQYMSNENKFMLLYSGLYDIAIGGGRKINESIKYLKYLLKNI